ncbi:uncharacterized protein [Drosophila suzukii]|uniref:Uncharacterized protein isoform X3 n=1 Tax=Drosophila suzukii TaxID=28584 RepID=A0ABM4U013_DROSZ
MCYGVVFGKEVQDDGKLGSNLGNSNTRPAATGMNAEISETIKARKWEDHHRELNLYKKRNRERVPI